MYLRVSDGPYTVAIRYPWSLLSVYVTVYGKMCHVAQKFKITFLVPLKCARHALRDDVIVFTVAHLVVDLYALTHAYCTTHVIEIFALIGSACKFRNLREGNYDVIYVYKFELRPCPRAFLAA